MKKTILLFTGICLFLSSSLIAGDITIGVPGGSGGVEVKGTWAQGSTVIVYDHMIIPAGESLTIEDGVNVQIADTTIKIELIVLGNFYCKGTEANPINISVKSDLIPANVATTNPFPGLWGGIICDTTCNEFLMLHTTMRYYGAATTNNSPSVLLQLYKNAAGQTEPFVNFRNHNTGKLVVEHCTFSNGMDDGIYIEGGNVIFAYNTVYQNGSTGGDATNLKAGTIADLCYNLYYSPNTNAFKLSNSGSRSPQCKAIVYNNTIVNAGWRRPTVKGGSVWYEAGVIGKTYNTLFINNRFGIKTDGKADTASRADYNYFYGYGQNVVNNFTATKGLYANGAHDVLGTTAGDKDPLLINYPLATDTMNSKYDPDWNFKLKSNSPAVGAGTINFARNFGTTGITIDGITYTSPEPSAIIGAFGASVAVEGISVSDAEVTLMVNETKNLTATVLPEHADTLSYGWTSSDPSIASVDENGVITALAGGSAKVYATTTNGNFSDTCFVTVTLPTSVSNLKEEDFSVFPNPVQSELQVRFTAESPQTQVMIYSSTGQLVIRRDFVNQTGKSAVTIELNTLERGMYFISLQNGTMIKTKSFIKK
jgi:hypothetical protein